VTKSETVQRRLHWPCTAYIPVVNHAPAPNSGECLTYMTLEENTLFHAAAVWSTEIVPTPQWTTKPCLLGAILFY